MTTLVHVIVCVFRAEGRVGSPEWMCCSESRGIVPECPPQSLSPPSPLHSPLQHPKTPTPQDPSVMQNHRPVSIFAPHELQLKNAAVTELDEVPYPSRTPSPSLPPQESLCLSRTSSRTSTESTSVTSSSATSYYNHGNSGEDTRISEASEYSTYSHHNDDTSMASGSLPSSGLMFKVQFKSTTDDFYLADSCTRDIAIGDYVKVEADRGHDVGTVSDIFWPSAEEKQAVAATNNKQIVSIASHDEYLLSKGKTRDEARALAICGEIVAARGMDIMLVDAEFQYDRKKLTFFFTSEGHTDFRELVRDLFTIFKTRIWMQKIKPFEAVAFQHANAPIPRFNGGSALSSSAAASARQHHRHQNPNLSQSHGAHPYVQQAGRYLPLANSSLFNKHKHKSSFPSSAENLSSDIYRTQLHLQTQTTHPYVHTYRDNDYDNISNDSINQNEYHRQSQGQGQQGYREQLERHLNHNLHLQQYNPPMKQQQAPYHPQPQFHQLQDPYQLQQNRSASSSQGQGHGKQEYTSFSAYASRFAPSSAHSPPLGSSFPPSSNTHNSSSGGNHLQNNAPAMGRYTSQVGSYF